MVHGCLIAAPVLGSFDQFLHNYTDQSVNKNYSQVFQILVTFQNYA